MSTKLTKTKKRNQFATSHKEEKEIYQYAYYCMYKFGLREITVNYSPFGAEEYIMATVPIIEDLMPYEDLKLLFDIICICMDMKNMVQICLSYRNSGVNVSWLQAADIAAAPFNCLSTSAFNQLVKV